MSGSSNNTSTSSSPLLLLAVLRQPAIAMASLRLSNSLTTDVVKEVIINNKDIFPNKKYTSKGSAFNIHYTLDTEGVIYAIVTEPNYPARVIYPALDEMAKKISEKLGARLGGASENGLNKSARPLLSEIADKYSDPSKSDALVSVQKKIDLVTDNMKLNIKQAIDTNEKLEVIEDKAIKLNEQSQAFQTGSKSLKDKMFWKKWKMRLIIGGIIVVLLIVIIVPIATSAQSSSNNGH